MVVRWCAMLATWASVALAAPPRVVSCTPDLGDAGVDPGLVEIRIEFDQEMGGGRSMCGGGPQFPTIAGTPRWEEKRVLIVPVRLAADHEYRFSINCPSAQNFRSAAGEAAEMTQIAFRTAKAGEAPTPQRRLTPGDNGPAIDALRKAIDEQYSYRDLRVKDWDGVFKASEEEMMGAKTPAAFARAAARMLGAAQDIHVRVAVNDQLMSTHRANVRANIHLSQLKTLVPGFVQRNGVVATGRWEGGIGYLQIGTWPGEDVPEAESIGPALTAIDEMMDCGALIVDVRSNGGGSETTARRVAARFVAEPTTYSLSQYRFPDSPTGWGEPIPRRVSPAGTRYEGRVFVLIGPACASSNESFIAMMKYGAGAELIGATTMGSSGNPRRTDLGNGVEVSLPSWKDLMPDGTLLEGVGIAPDVEAGVGADFGSADPVVEAAVERVRANR